MGRLAPTPFFPTQVYDFCMILFEFDFHLIFLWRALYNYPINSLIRNSFHFQPIIVLYFRICDKRLGKIKLPTEIIAQGYSTLTELDA